jgi:protocatechuate 3,4-dioxygenase beta subunit
VPGARAAVPEGPALAIALRKECSIAGRVVDEAGKPVPGARVAIPRELGMRRLMRLGRGAFRTAETKTAPDGTFSLRRLGPEPGITLEATKSGYAAGRKTGIRLKTGEALKGVSVVLRQGLVARGRVVDAEGKPIAGAEVRSARAERGRRGNFAFVRGFGQEEKPDAVSVADGGFVLRGLEAARYQVSASKEGLLAKAPATVDVVEKGENEIPPIVLEAGVAIAGAVRNVKGEPVPDAQIFVASEGSPPPGSTDPNGRFRIAGLPSGRPVMFFVSAPGYAQRQSNATPPAENLTITLDTAATVRGRVEDAESKSPLADFSISRSESSSGGGGMVIRFGSAREARSFHAGDGSFELPGVPPGRWTFRAEAAGYRSAEVSGVEVAAGETKEGVVLSLKRGGSLSGRVIESARGAPVANASVSWRASGGGAGFGFRFGPDAQQQTTSDADGRFSFDSLPEGKVTLEASHPDYVDGSLEVDPGKQSAVEISLGTGGSIAGTVVGSDGRMPAGGAQVLLDAQGESGRFGGNEATTADGSGAFLFDHLQAGRYQLVAQGNAGSSAPKEVVLADNQRADGVVLQTATGTLLRGTVSGLPAAALAGLRIFASSASYSDGATTDAEGRFTIRDVPSGVLHVTASTSSFVQGRTAQTTVEVPDGVPEFPVEIVFEGTSRLSGQVTRGGRPLSGLFVSATPDPPAGGGRSSGQTDGDGRYDLEGLSDGPYEVSVQGQGVGYRKSFQVSGDSNGDIALPGTSLSGAVRDESGQPIDGADVQAETGQETQAFSVKRGVTDSNGTYSIEDLDPGNYRVTARKTGYRLDTEPATIGSDPASLDFTLKKGTGLSIRVADGQTGIPLAGVQALAFAADGTVAYQGRVALGADGTGEVPSLSDGAYTLYVFSDGYAARSLPVNVPSSPVLLAMTPGGRVEVRTPFSVSGRLLDAGGGIVLLSPWRLEGTLTAAAPISAWEHLAPGSYQWISGDGAGQKSTPFAVTEGQTTRIDLK